MSVEHNLVSGAIDAGGMVVLQLDIDE